MDQLTRFARQLVERLGQRPGGAQRPVSVADVRSTILPYRAQRRALGLESVEDYETVLLRLIAEERGYVKTLPAAAAVRCREVLAQPNPDLGVLEEIADSTIQVTSLAAGKIVELEDPSPASLGHPERSEGSSGKPGPSPAPQAQDDTGKGQARDDSGAGGHPDADPERSEGEEEGSTAAPAPAPQADGDSAPPSAGAEGQCRFCLKAVPVGRTVVFCPWCGERLIPLRCARCGTELESGWQHCITCGAPVQDPYAKS